MSRILHILVVEDDEDDFILTSELLRDMPDTQTTITRSSNYAYPVGSQDHKM